MPELICRRAKDEELPAILEMQAKIFSGEQGIPADDVDTFLAKRPIIWCALMDGVLCGAAAAWREQDALHWGRFVILPGLRGSGIGTTLARYTFTELFSDSADPVLMEARDTTVRIVCRMGGIVTGEPFPFFIGNVTPVTLTRDAFLKAIG